MSFNPELLMQMILVDTDISGEDSDVQGICNSVWTQSVKDAWKAKLIADKNLHPGG